MPSPSVFERLKERKLVQWAIAYLAGAWVLVEATSLVVEQFHWSEVVGQVVTIVAFFGFLIVLVLAWYHGEKGHQGVSRMELLIVSVLLVVTGGVLSTLGGGEERNKVPPVAELLRLEDDPRPSIAVLPFEAYSADSDAAFLADGLTEELIAELSRIEGLRVSSRTSVMAYKGTDQALPTIGSELQVGYIVEGSAFSVDDSIRITAQLVEAASDEHIWVGQYPGDLGGVFSLISDVAREIALGVSVRLTPQDEARISAAQAVDPEAFRLYTRGLHLRHLEGARNYVQASAYFEQAIQADPEFSPAYARFALCQAILVGVYGYNAEEMAPRAREAAATALGLNPASSEAWVAIGLIREFMDVDWRGAEEAFLEAIRLNPGNLEPHLEYGLLLNRWTEDRERTFAAFQTALTLDPVSIQANSAITEALMFYREYEEAVEYCRKALALEPNKFIVIYRLGHALHNLGRSEEALREYERMLALDRGPFSLSATGHMYAVMGREEEARALLEELRRDWPDAHHAHARLLGGLGDWEGALTSLEAHFEGDPGFGPGMLRDAFFDPIRSHPRFLAILERFAETETL